jgi:hypothetical protein
MTRLRHRPAHAGHFATACPGSGHKAEIGPCVAYPPFGKQFREPVHAHGDLRLPQSFALCGGGGTRHPVAKGDAAYAP